jgi:DNA polymerase III subunit gamma/tau
MGEKLKLELASNNLALKYRPTVLSDIAGQPHIVNAIQGMINSRKIHQSILLHGPSGNGKTTLARIIARYVNCEELTEDNQPCGKCRSCAYNSKDHPDVTELNAASTRGIDEVRELIRISRMAPNFNFRIFILDEIHNLTPQAKEAFLKPLEEPTSQTIWILCTTNPEKLTATIRGRCKDLEVKPLDNMTCAKLLYKIAKREEIEIDKTILLKIASLTGNQPRASIQALNTIIDAIKLNKEVTPENYASIIKDTVGLPPYQGATNYVKAIYGGNYKQAFEAVETVVDLIPFINLVLEYHYKITRFYITGVPSAEWFDRKIFEAVAEFKEKFISRPDIMSGIMTKLVKCNSLVKEFEVNSKFVITATTLEIIEEVRRKLNSK